MATIRALAQMAGVMAVCGLLSAQTGTTTISIELRDGKTGRHITPSNFLLRVNHNETVRNEWVTINDDGTANATIPEDVKELSLQATYGSGMDYYVNCDAAKQSDKDREIWYPVDMILKSGVVAPNECGKTEYTARPGEFVFYVRKRGVLDPLH